MGGYVCQLIDPCFNKSCSDGFKCTVNARTASCIDVDECGDDPCGDNLICRNTIGSYICAPIDHCVSQPCDSGYTCLNNAEAESGFTCHDINECQNDQQNCKLGFRCNNLLGSFECVDLDECLQLGKFPAYR